MFIRTFKFTVILAIGWCLLSGHLTILLLALGLISCGISVWVYNRVIQSDHPQQDHWLSLSNPLGHVKYCLWLLKEIVLANLEVMRAIADPKRVKSRIFSVDCGSLSETGKVIYANSITLTPGTVTTEISSDSLSIHALTQASYESTLDDTMRNKVAQLCQKDEMD